MEDAMKARLSNQSVWMRGLYMLLFVIAYGIAEILLTVIVIFQFVAVLITGEVNGALLRFGKNLSAYFYQIISYLTFNDETRPYPFTDWPDEEPGETPWSPGSAATVPPQASAPEPAPSAPPPSPDSDAPEPPEPPEPRPGPE